MADLLAALDHVLATANVQALSLESDADRAELRRLVAAALGESREIPPAAELAEARAERARLRKVAGDALGLAHRLASSLEARSDQAARRGWAAQGRAEVDGIYADMHVGTPHRWCAITLTFLDAAVDPHILMNVALRAVDTDLESNRRTESVRVEWDMGGPPRETGPRAIETDDDILRLMAEAGGARP